MSTATKKKVAAVITEYRERSHADVIIGRLLNEYEGYHPRIEVVSMYLDQFPDNDMSRELAAKNGIPIFPTIRDAIAVGDSGVKIDGVVIIGEHGNYPINEKKQKMYPRRRFLEETLKALDELGLKVPIFNDKHLSYDIDDVVWMYEQLKTRSLPFLGGSSIPHTPDWPAYDRSKLENAKEVLVVGWLKDVESYGFHSLDVLQSLAERRRGGETGVASIEALEGEAVWEAMDRGVWPEDLLLKALSTYETPLGHPRDVKDLHPTLFIVEYKDGFKGYVAQLEDFVGKWMYAFRTEDGEVTGARCESGKGYPYIHFTKLTELLEDMVITGRSAVPLERTFLSSGMIDLAMESLYQKKKLATPQLDVSYKPL